MPENKVNPRKTFAIISHPDAGKTTLTEKLLLSAVPFSRPELSKPAVKIAAPIPTG